MNLSMYQASVPVCMRMFRNFVRILEKGGAYAAEREIDPSVLLDSRLFPDMFPLVRQVQVATDIGKRGMERLAGDEVTFVEDAETSFEELIGPFPGKAGSLMLNLAAPKVNPSAKIVQIDLDGDEIGRNRVQGVDVGLVADTGLVRRLPLVTPSASSV